MGALRTTADRHPRTFRPLRTATDRYGPAADRYWPSLPLQVVVMIHSGSRGLGHQVATDALTSMERAMARDGIKVRRSRGDAPCESSPAGPHRPYSPPATLPSMSYR